MYSVVMLAALTTGSATPQFFFHRGCHSCHGCYGACYGSCFGNCFGCGGCHGCFGGCHGCFGGCHGCFGGCHSCFGGMGCYGCYGGFGYYGCAFDDCYGSSVGCWGAPYGCYGPGFHGHEWGGAVPVAPAAPAAPAERPDTPRNDNNKDTGDNGAISTERGRLVVEMPRGARLFVDGKLIPNKDSTQRTFRTPTLESGARYYYDVRVEVEQYGKPVSQTRRVIVQAGAVSRVDFTNLDTPATATVRAR